jgi:TatD DNase family protein
MSAVLIDAHAHLDQYSDDELPEVLQEIEESPTLTISTAMNPKAYCRARELAGQCRYVIPTFGIHPWDAQEYVGKLGEFEDLIEESPMLGEIGLDYHFVQDASYYGPQRQVLEHLLADARDQGKIVNLHTKGAEGEVLDLLLAYEIERAIVHWYSGPLDVLLEMSRLGCYFTIGVEVIRSEQIKQIARMIPEDQILTETDNPGAWEWLTGERGMPDQLDDVIAALADVRGISEHEIAQAVRENFLLLIRNDPWMNEVHDELLQAGIKAAG